MWGLEPRGPIEVYSYVSNPNYCAFQSFHQRISKLRDFSAIWQALDKKRHYTFKKWLLGVVTYLAPYSAFAPGTFSTPPLWGFRWFFSRVFAPAENLAFQKESWINSKRHNKRHVRNEWKRGQAFKAVDGVADSDVSSCFVLDNLGVDRPTFMVDLGSTRRVSGIVIVTWNGRFDLNCHALSWLRNGGE